MESMYKEAPITREILRQLSINKSDVKVEQAEAGPYLEQYRLRGTPFWWSISDVVGESEAREFRIRRSSGRYMLVFYWQATPILESELEAARPGAGRSGMDFLWERILDSKRVMELKLRI